MSDIVDDLRDLQRQHEKLVTFRLADTCREAADEIERLRSVLRGIANMPIGRHHAQVERCAMQEYARKALGDS